MGGLGYVDSHEPHYRLSVETLAAWLGVERNGQIMLNIYEYAISLSWTQPKQNRDMNLINLPLILVDIVNVLIGSMNLIKGCNSGYKSGNLSPLCTLIVEFS